MEKSWISSMFFILVSSLVLIDWNSASTLGHVDIRNKATPAQGLTQQKPRVIINPTPVSEAPSVEVTTLGDEHSSLLTKKDDAFSKQQIFDTIPVISEPKGPHQFLKSDINIIKINESCNGDSTDTEFLFDGIGIGLGGFIMGIIITIIISKCKKCKCPKLGRRRQDTITITQPPALIILSRDVNTENKNTYTVLGGKGHADGLLRDGSKIKLLYHRTLNAWQM